MPKSNASGSFRSNSVAAGSIGSESAIAGPPVVRLGLHPASCLDRLRISGSGVGADGVRASDRAVGRRLPTEGAAGVLIGGRLGGHEVAGLVVMGDAEPASG